MYSRILLIDDDDDDQFIFLGALEIIAPGCYCHTSNNALEALKYLNNGSEIPDILFLDLNMPLMNGFEFLLILKSNPRFSPIPVVIFSTTDNPEDQTRAEELGAVHFIVKTPDIRLLKEDLSYIFNTAPLMESRIH